MIETVQGLISCALGRVGKGEDAQVADMLRVANILLNHERAFQQDRDVEFERLKHPMGSRRK